MTTFILTDTYSASLLDNFASEVEKFFDKKPTTWNFEEGRFPVRPNDNVVVFGMGRLLPIKMREVIKVLLNMNVKIYFKQYVTSYYLGKSPLFTDTGNLITDQQYFSRLYSVEELREAPWGLVIPDVRSKHVLGHVVLCV